MDDGGDGNSAIGSRSMGATLDSRGTGTRRLVQRPRDLEVYQRAFTLSMRIFELSKQYPKEETYSLTDQIRRASRSVCANVAEAWRKRRYPAAFVSKLSDAEAEAAETQVWLEFSVACGYMDRQTGKDLHEAYDQVIRSLIGMANHADDWVLPTNGGPR
jgi:four helix bundle protein